MMKRALSLLLCLIMVFGIAAPTVQATGTDDIYISDGTSLDDIIVGDNVQLDNVVIDGSNVGPAPNPTELMSGSDDKDSSPMFAEPQPTVPADTGCNCDECETIAEHKADCMVKVELNKVCGNSADDIFAQWNDFTTEQQTYILQYMEENFSGRYADLVALINAPTGSASETYADGTTVSVEGIPEDGILTIQEASDEVKEIVGELVAEQEYEATELFTYDVSVQDGEGADWQPETNVKMEMEIPGAKLHKYAKVYVVHVDDNGEASTIEAEVTEDGKIAFETPGFSTFAGFTVDFEYNGEAFSINGLTEILVSEVMDTLKMPLYIEDVADVSFSDETLISVTAQEGDWLLTSLHAFDSEEELTLTMVDGTQYVINVTDAATFSPQADIKIGSTYYDSDNNGVCNWYLDGQAAYLGNAYAGHAHEVSNAGTAGDGWSKSSVITIEGPGTFQINLQHQQNTSETDYFGGDSCALRLDLYQIRITGGAKLVFRLGGSFSGKEKSLTIRGTGSVPIFNIEDGSLFFCVSDNTLNADTGDKNADGTDYKITLPAGASKSFFGTGYADGHIPVYLDGQDLGTSASTPLIYHKQGKDEVDRQNLIVEDVTFKNANHRAVLTQTNNMTNVCFTNCTFSSTVRSIKYGGGALYFDGDTDTSYNGGVNVADIKRLILTNCTFSGNSGASGHGGAIACYSDVARLYVNGCTFKDCTSVNRAGAIEISVSSKTADNNILDWVKFKNTSFTNCVAGSHGGAIDISNGDAQYHLASDLTIEGCTFTNCKATGNRGGALRMVVGSNARNLTIKNSGFSGCTAGSAGGAISVQGIIGNVTITGSKSDAQGAYTFRNCSSNDHGGALLIDCASGCGNITLGDSTVENGGVVVKGNSCSARGAGVAVFCPTVGNISLNSSTISNNTSGTLGGGFFVGIRGDAAGPITAGDVAVNGCTFSGNTSNGVGACLSITDGTYNSVLVQNCSFSNSYAANYGGAIGLKVYADDSTEKFPVKVTNNVQILDSTFDNCTSGGLSPEPYDHDGDPATEMKTTWDHDGNPDTAEITRLNGTGGGGAIAIGAEVGGSITIKSTTANANTAADDYATKFTNCATWNNGGAVDFLGTVKTSKIDVQYVLVDGCRARDAGGAIYLSNLIVDDMKVDTCTIRNCSYFTDDYVIDIPGTAYDSLGKETYKAYDASGTFRCIGNTTCRAWIYMCTFTNNTSYSNGGGVYWNANNIRTGAGGATVTPSLKIQWSVFDGNHADRDGGGVYVEATVQVIGSQFKNNSVDGRGGAIAQQVYNNEARTLGVGEATNLSLDANTTIFNNTAVHGGGISITVSKTVSIADGTNLLYPVKFTLGGASVYENYASQNGGGIYYATTSYSNALEQREVDNFQKEILINNGKIFSNISGYYDPTDSDATSQGGHGGGIYMSSNQVNIGEGTGYSKVSITSGSIYDNHAISGNGGGVYVTGINALCSVTGGAVGARMDIGKLTPFPNTAKHGMVDGVSTGGTGGGIAVFDGARIEMEGGSVVNNVATQAGGGIAVHKNSTMYMTDGDVQYNTSNFGGGISVNACPGNPSETDITKKYGMYFEAGDVSNNLALASGTVNDLQIANDNYIAYGGGICLADGATMRFDDGTVVNNIAARSMDVSDPAKIVYTYSSGSEGGGIAVCQNSTMDIYGGEIDTNNAYDGAGMVVRGGSTLNMRTSETDATKVGIIKNNDATHYGGGIYGYGATVNVYDGQIIKNSSKRGGGGYFGNSSTVLLKGGKVEENAASGNGGGLYFNASNVTIDDGSVSKNTSSVEAGGILVYGVCDVTINDGSISENEANGNGGGVYVGGASTVTINGGSICDNKGRDGGGLWVKYSSGAPEVTIYGGIISRNNARQSGGGIFVHGDTKTGTKLNVYGGEVSYNTAGERGGGINADNWATVLVSKHTKTDGTVTRPQITNNTGGRGGGIYVCFGAELTVDEGFITFNHAKGTCSYTTAKNIVDGIYGIGGGVGISAGDTTNNKPTKFTLTGDNMAIYGNLADFGADDVYSNGTGTELSIPQVSTMNLAGYKFKPEAWFEDYPIDDSAYESGLNLGAEDGIKNGNVYRYRGASSGHRIIITESDVTNKVNAANSYVCMTLGIPAAVDDTVVVDFGLPVKIDVISNDVILSSDELKNTGTIGASAPSVDNEEKIFEYNGIIYGGLDSNFSANNLTLTNLKHGTATLDRTKGELKYQMNTNDFSMASEDSFYYAVYHEVPTSEDVEATGYYYYGKVTVIPATSIYFEDNFGAISYVGNWENLGRSNPNDADANSQGQDRVGESEDLQLDVDNVYGYDAVYNEQIGHSLGSSKKITVSDGVDGTATFTFTGTGFDIISHCNNNTGMIMVNIYEGNKVDSSKLATTLMVDTFYGCTTECYKVDFTFTDGKWTRVDTPIEQNEMGHSEDKPATPKEGDTFTIYMAKVIPVTDGSAQMCWQVPVLKADMNQITKTDGTAYGYGTYTVEIYVAWSWWTESGRPDYDNCSFYLDAIRIYDPANNGIGNDTIQNAYLADHEGWPTYQELRNMFITQENLTNKPTSGAVFIDGFGSYTVTNYQNFGPNNEVYLATNQTIAFKLDELSYNNGFTSGSFDDSETSIIDNIHIAMKALNGSTEEDVATVQISNGSVVMNETLGNTDMYFDITDMMNSVVTITNTGSNIVSITNVKVTHTEDPAVKGASLFNLFQVNDEIAESAIAILSGDTVAEQPVLTLKYPTLSFEGQIRYNAYFAVENLGDLNADDLGLAVFSTEDVDGTVDTADYIVNGASAEGNLFMVSTNGIAAKNLGDDLYFKVFARLADGSYVYSDMRSYNAVQYAKGILAGNDESQKALVVAMLNYGAEAQKYFNYNGDAAMNSFVTAEQQALLNGYSVSMLDPVDTVDASKAAAFAYNGGYDKRYPTVSFEGAFQINYYFQPSNSVDDVVNFYYWTEDTYNSVDELTAENADGNSVMTLTNGEYTAVSGEIVAKDLDQTVYVAAVYESEGVVYNTGVLAYSLSAYCQEHSVDATDSMYDFANAAAVYGCAAKDYFAA